VPDPAGNADRANGPAHSGFSGGSGRRGRPDPATPPGVLWTGGNAADPL